MQEVSEYEANGMVVARGSHHLHQEMLSNGSWRSRYSGSNSGQLRLLEFYREVGETFPLVRARLEPGDVVLFSKCSVHTTSGVNSLARQRYAWQVRLITEDSSLREGASSQPSLYPVMGSSLADRGYSQPQVWPHTLPEEDEVRAGGHLTLSRLEWLRLLLSHPQHLLVTNTVRTLETIGAFQPSNSLLPTLVDFLENIGLLS